MSKGIFKTLCKINTALGGNNVGCVGNKDVLDRIAAALGASSSEVTKYSAEALKAIADNIDDESPEGIQELQIALAKARNERDAYADATLSSYINESLSSVRPYRFAGFSQLSMVSVPAATTVGEYAFTDCTSLEEVDISAATTIGYCAFKGCSSLSKVELNSVQMIESEAFGNCRSLSEITMDVDAVPVLTDNMQFGSAGRIQFYVRQSMISAFKTATNWSAYSNFFYPILPED